MTYPYQLKSKEDYTHAYKKSIENPSKFWLDVSKHFVWKKSPSLENILSWDFKTPDVKWFDDATLNITENCLDRHLATQADKVAIIWEPNDPSEEAIKITYSELHQRVMDFAQLLKNQGVQKGDRVCIYMGMIPETVVAMLACARIGAIHSVVFGGFSAQSIADRLIDAGIEYIITQDEAKRANKTIPLKSIVDEAIINCDFVKKVIVFQHTKSALNMHPNRDVWWHEELKNVHHNFYKSEIMNAEDPLFILYTSGSTGKPKGVVHSTAGYMVYATYTFINVFQYQPHEVFFCTADVGWITGHSYLVYGPLCAGATILLFEGVPTWPDAGRLWDIVDKHEVNILYTAPTAIRSLMTFGDQPFAGKRLDSLRVLGTVGEPINEEAWHWYFDKVGKGRCPIVDTWWQTETGGIMISNLAGITDSKPTYATLPLPGVQLVLVDEKGNLIHGGDSTEPAISEVVSGNLCVKFPWPSIIRTTYNNHERCRQSYFETYPDLYFTGDGCIRDADGNYRITGRVDDVLNVSGHRIGTAEVENAINEHPTVIESAVVGYPHDIKGQGIYAFVICQNNTLKNDVLEKEILDVVAKFLGAFAKPDKIQIVAGLPKTRSGKIMRRILRKIAENEIENIGDTTTLLDPAVVDDIIKERK